MQPQMIDCDFATFRAAMIQRGLSADAQPGSLVTLLSPRERRQRRKRNVQIVSAGRTFRVTVPFDLGRELVTNSVPEANSSHMTLAKCFGRACYATMSRAAYERRGLQDHFGSYDEHIGRMHGDGSSELADSLRNGLTTETFAALLYAVDYDMFQSINENVDITPMVSTFGERVERGRALATQMQLSTM